ncbi:hypothetical protein GGR52DRAFT_63095 [Hypoxylon sp. FL1284]|nr:hypothetical protein GGR52DRAFT_63095 [Hypoxylon sp. FL1284]
MQFTIGRSTHGHRAPSQNIQPAVKPEALKQSHTKQNRYGKSQPFDPEDLRQRLFVVIAEQEALKEKQRRERLEAAKSKQDEGLGASTDQPEADAVDITVPDTAAAKPEDTDTSFAARAARKERRQTNMPSSETIPNPSDAKIGRSMSKSIHDKLRRRPSRMESTATNMEGTVKPPSYHHVPQEAASQFARTATSNGMLDKHLVHSLSQSALKFHLEGRISDQIELESSTTPAQQTRALKRAQSHREKLRERNQFQYPRKAVAPVDERGSNPEDGRRHHHQPSHRHSVVGLAAATKPPTSSRRKDSFGNIPEDDSPGDELASEETLVADPAEHRVDWTQSDEPYAKPRPVRNPLLRKADSIWTLKRRLGKSGHARDDKRFPAPREKHVDGPVVPLSQPKTHRLAFFAKLRRVG